MSDTKVDIFMPLYVSDYDRDTSDLSFEEHGFYGAILRALWVRGGVLEAPLEAQPKQRLSRILRTDEATFDRLWPSVERFFTFGADGTFSQKRLTAELNNARKHKEIAVERARKGGLARARSFTPSTASSSAKSAASSKPEEQLRASTSPSPSEERAPARPRDLWPAWRWYEKFKAAWPVAHGKIAYGDGDDDAKATGELDDKLNSLPGEDRAKAEAEIEALFSRYFAIQKAAGHPWKWFVERFNELRIPPARGSPRVVQKPNGEKTALERAAQEWSGR